MCATFYSDEAGANGGGWQFPTFRLLNKLARSTFSKPYETSTNTRYHILAVSNSKGWFAAARFNGTTYGEFVLWVAVQD
jgi:hypothetical protein